VIPPQTQVRDGHVHHEIIGPLLDIVALEDEGVMPKADRPEAVAKVVLSAATDKRPRRRYTAGKTARLVSLLRRFTPAQTFDKTLRKQFRLPV